METPPRVLAGRGLCVRNNTDLTFSLGYRSPLPRRENQEVTWKKGRAQLMSWIRDVGGALPRCTHLVVGMDINDGTGLDEERRTLFDEINERY